MDLNIEVFKYTKDRRDDWNGLASQSLFFFNREYMEYKPVPMENSCICYLNKVPVAIFPAVQDSDSLISYKYLTYGGLIYSPSLITNQVFHIYEHVLNFYRISGVKKIRIKLIPAVFRSCPFQADNFYLFRQSHRFLDSDLNTIIDLKNPLPISSQKKKYVRNATKRGLCCSENLEHLNSFYKILEDILASKYGVKPTHTFEELSNLVKMFPLNIKLFTVSSTDEAILAGALVFDFEHVVHTQYLANSLEGQKIGALDMVISHLKQHYAATHNFLSLGRSTTPSGDLNWGLLNSKEGMGGRSIPCIHLELLI